MMHAYPMMSFNTLYFKMTEDLLKAGIFPRGRWQSQDISAKPEMHTRELLNVMFQYAVPDTVSALQKQIEPNLPWAEDHFMERVGGEPLNPPPSEAWWPFAQQGNREHKPNEHFSHTYPERMWPKWAGEHYAEMEGSTSTAWEPNRGIRFDYGDLEDVVNQLVQDPLTRQAYLPIWFPEDTGAVHGERVPCTLGYHFIMDKNWRLHISYFMRSCDLIRHFRDDVYMAARLLQWVTAGIHATVRVGEDHPIPQAVRPGNLTMHIVNLHAFRGDQAMMEFNLNKHNQNRYGNL